MYIYLTSVCAEKCRKLKAEVSNCDKVLFGRCMVIGTVIGLGIPSKGGLCFMTWKVMFEVSKGFGSIEGIIKRLER